METVMYTERTISGQFDYIFPNSLSLRAAIVSHVSKSVGKKTVVQKQGN